MLLAELPEIRTHSSSRCRSSRYCQDRCDGVASVVQLRGLDRERLF
jgi:hypothetical protein